MATFQDAGKPESDIDVAAGANDKIQVILLRGYLQSGVLQKLQTIENGNSQCIEREKNDIDGVARKLWRFYLRDV